MSTDLRDIAKDGTLRVAFILGNRALVQRNDQGALEGVTPAIAHRLCDALGLTLVPVIYPGAGKVFEAALQGEWDVGFLAIDPKRRERLSYTRPYHTISATYAAQGCAL